MNQKKDRRELLNKALMTLKALCERHEVFISLVPPFYLSFDVDRDTLSQCLKGSDISEKAFRAESNRLGSLLLTVLQQREEQFIESRVEELELKDQAAEEERKTLQAALASVRGALWDQHLQDRYDLKATSKAPSFSSIDWDIKLKVRDAKLARIRFPYATCRIAFQREFESSPFTLLGGKTFDTVQINFSIDEIEHLIRVFTTIRKHLEEIEAEAKK